MSLRADVHTDVRRVRERFLGEGALEAETLPATLLDSWRRSQAMRVHPDRLDLPFVRQPNTESRLAHAADPVLQSATQDVLFEAMSAILTSADGVVIERSVSESAFMTALDSVSLVPGYSYAEEFAGTNGIGTALETGRPVFIRGGEHFVGPLGELACAGAPIRDPITQRVVGVIDLTCGAGRSNPVMLPLVKSLGSQIEDRMRESAHASEIALLDAYRAEARRFPFGVLAIGGDVLLMSRYLRQTLDTNDQIVLIDHASDLVSSTLSGTALAVLPSARIAKITAADRSTMRGGQTNVVFHVELSVDTRSPTRSGRSAPLVIPGLAGRNGAWLRCCEQVQQCCRDRNWVVIEGENGSGRSRMAQAVGQYVKPGRSVRIMRAGTFDSAARFVAELAAESGDDDFALVLADIDDIDTNTIEAIASLLAARVGRGWIAATTRDATSSAVMDERFLRMFTHTVTVPALRHRTDDLEELVALLLREITHGADVRLAPDAMRQLSRLPWPGNVSQLRRVLIQTVARQRSGLIESDKLPPECRSVTRRRLTRIEALERDAIVRSLEDNNGSKQEAARALGMSRATIYRKIKDYGIA